MTEKIEQVEDSLNTIEQAGVSSEFLGEGAMPAEMIIQLEETRTSLNSKI